MQLKPDCDDIDEWAHEIDCLADKILWDRDWELDELMVDSSPEKAQLLKLHMGIDDDYFTSIAPDPCDLNQVRRTLRRLNDAYVRKYDHNGNVVWTRQFGTTTSEAASRVVQAFDLPTFDLGNYDPVAATLGGDPLGPVVFAAHAQIQDTIAQATTLFAAVDGAPSRPSIAQQMLTSLANHIAASAVSMDLGDPGTIAQVLSEFAADAGLPLDAAIVAGAAAVIAESNDLIAAIPPSNDVGYLVAVAQVKVVARGDVADQLADAAAGNIPIEQVVALNTGAPLAQQVAAALTPPTLTLPGPVVMADSTSLSGAEVAFDVSAADLTGQPLDVICTAASADFFPIGQTVVSCSASDAMGNVASGNFVIQVVNTIIHRSIIVLNQTAAGAFDLHGDAEVDVPGLVLVNSSSNKAVKASGKSSVYADSIQIVGGMESKGESSFYPAPTLGIEPFDDPLSLLPVPDNEIDRGSVDCGGHSRLTIHPGVYDSLKAGGNCQLEFSPGVYVIRGGELKVSGNAVLSGSEVVLYQAGSNFPAPGGKFKDVQFSGHAAIQLSPPSSGAYQGIVLFQARDNDKRIALQGNVTGLSGTIYAPAATVEISGHSEFHVSLIVDRLDISGHGSNSLGDNAGSDPNSNSIAIGVPNSIPFSGSTENSGQTPALLTPQPVVPSSRSLDPVGVDLAMDQAYETMVATRIESSRQRTSVPPRNQKELDLQSLDEIFGVGGLLDES